MSMVEAETSASGVYLDTFLAPLSPWLERPDVTDIYLNKPQEIWVETLHGKIEQHSCEALTSEVVMRLARQVAARSAQGISREYPLLAANLPGGERIQVVAPPATRGEPALAIRKHVSASLSLQDYCDQGAFEETGANPVAASPQRATSLRAVPSCDAMDVLSKAVRMRRNILISGGTSTGKTTFLNALLREIPPAERLVLIEDTPELEMTHSNSVGLLAARSELSETSLAAEDLLIAALRMRPDRIILGELRGREAFTFLRSVNTGHPGSMTTIHADTPERAIEQLALLVLQSGARLRWDDVVRYVRSSIDMFVQLERSGGRRSVSSLLEKVDAVSI